LDRVTARHSYCVWLFSKLIEERQTEIEGYGEFTKDDISRIAESTLLGAAYVQQCRDRALWIWRSYHAQHEEWEKQLKNARGTWREKLLKREPRKPFRDGLTKKIPIRIDARTGTVEASKRIKLSPHVLRLSSLRKGVRITVPLNPAKYHLEFLRKGRVVDFQLVKQGGKYCAHICVKYEVADVPARAVRGIDLGVRRAMATVLLKPNQPLRRQDLSILKDGQKYGRLDLLNRRIARLQQTRKWEPLKRLRHKRRNIAEYYDRLCATRIAELAKQECSVVAIGYPKGIKHQNYRGNRRHRLRRMLQRYFPYGRRIQYVQEECAERGVRAEPVLEYWTSTTCHRCSSTRTFRIKQSLICCPDCGLQYNADWNAAINIGSVLLPAALSRGATGGLAYAGDEPASEAGEPRSPKGKKC